MPVTETIDEYGRRVQGNPCSCGTCQPSMGHQFTDDLTCAACGTSLEAHQAEPQRCGGDRAA